MLTNSMNFRPGTLYLFPHFSFHWSPAKQPWVITWRFFFHEIDLYVTFCCGILRYFEQGCRKNVHATIPRGNVGYDQYTVPHTAAVEPTSALADIYPWPILPFFQISLKNSELNWPPTILFGIVACTFSDDLSRNSCTHLKGLVLLYNSLCAIEKNLIFKHALIIKDS